LGGSLSESFLVDGFLLEKSIGVGQPKRIEKAKILIANTAMDTDKIKLHSARVHTDNLELVGLIEEAERERMLAKCQKIVDHGINVFINRQLIYNLPEQFFAEKGVMAIEHADFDGIERLALVLDGEIVSTFDNPSLVKLGECDLIEEVMVAEDKMIKFSGVKSGAACSIVLRGPTNHILDEADRSIHDAISVLSQTVKEPRTVLGAGCSEMIMAKAVEEKIKDVGGKEGIALEAFARALRQIPTILTDNAGYDSAELVSSLRAEHAKGNTKAGLDLNKGVIADVEELGIIESWKVKNQILISGAEAAEMILRVDQIFKSAPRRREEDPRYA